ncbi:hypothetical protein PQO03_04610 [Lentisphaera profundi]|uniref:Serine aminopeptidase S33 domain-containing protein n=1 Tax=Lentisphaera profundi TaxID=1658616 RepID=A0ABY7VSQ0_9BACT|nr:hypothetical protein [Lentisphaera profundi]WDE97235.1 hypothetical protein PQO03_04610 [Lentisphaera profundi]
MKLIAIPGWACDHSYFDFLGQVTCFDWSFYAHAKTSPEDFLIAEANQEFIFIAYSLGSLYIDKALESPLCKGIICLSGFNAFCGNHNADPKLIEKIDQMQLGLKENPHKLIKNFQQLAGSVSHEKEFYNVTALSKGLDLLKTKILAPTHSDTKVLLLRGRKDRVLHPKVSLQLSKNFPNAEIHVLTEEAHDLSQSVAALELIETFIGKCHD